MIPETNLVQHATSRRGFLKAAGLGVAVLGSANLLAACGSAGTSAGPKAAGALAKPTPFHLASARIDNYLLDMVALDQNLYGSYNLEVGKFLYPQSGVQGMQLLAAGAADAMLQDMMLVLAGYVNSEKGKRPQIVGVRVPETTYGIVAGPKLSLPGAGASFTEKMQALKGKRIGVTAVGAGADQQLRLALQAAGMKYNDVTHLGIGNQIPAGAAQLKAGRIDAYVSFTYTVGEIIAALSGGSIYLQFSDPSVPADLSHQQVDVDIVREDFLQANPDVVKAWLAVNTQAKDWVLANKAKAADLLNTQSLGGKSPQIATSYIDHYANSLVPKIQPGWKATRAGIELMIKIGTTEGVVKPGQVTYEDLVPAFARA